MNKIYITTPIFYVNDLPHIGHAYTKLFVIQLQNILKIKNLMFYLLPEQMNMGLKLKKQQKKIKNQRFC